MLGVPLMRKGTPIGVFGLVRRSVRPFSDKQIELLITFADQAVIAIENVRLFDEVQARTRELSEALEQQTATSEVLRVISSSPGQLEPVFEAMLQNATRICEAKFGTMYLREGDAFRAVALHNAPPAFAEYLPPGGPAVHRQANRAGAEFRRASCHRHREHPAAQRAAGIPSTANRHRRRAEGHQPLDIRASTRSRHSDRERDEALRSRGGAHL